IRAARKQILPRCVTEDYNWIAPGSGCVFRQQSSAQRGANAKHLKVVAGDQLPLERMAIQTAIEILNRCYFGESGVVLFELLIFAPRKRVCMTSAIRPGEAVQAIRVAQGNWTKDIRVEERKERRVETQAESDGPCHREDEPGVT